MKRDECCRLGAHRNGITSGDERLEQGTPDGLVERFGVARARGKSNGISEACGQRKPLRLGNSGSNEEAAKVAALKVHPFLKAVRA